VTEAQATAAILAALSDVAPEADPSRLDVHLPVQDQVDLDSMDFLTFVDGVRARTGVDVPEAEYRQLVTIASGARYLASQAP
jgi:acyl carrier protein